MEPVHEHVALIRTEQVRAILERKGHGVWSLPPDATAYDAVAMMAEKWAGALVVVSEGQPVGVVSERDYARKVILRGKSSRDTRLDEIMSSPVITATPDDYVEHCLRIMTDNRVRHLPVMEAGRLAGLVSIGDLVSSLISVQAETIRHLSDYITGRYPA